MIWKLLQVNNAGIGGVVFDGNALRGAVERFGGWVSLHVILHTLHLEKLNASQTCHQNLGVLLYTELGPVHLLMQPTDEQEWKKMASQDYKLAKECVETNYYGAKRVTEALLPMLQQSDSARIVNVASFLGLLEVANTISGFPVLL